MIERTLFFFYDRHELKIRGEFLPQLDIIDSIETRMEPLHPEGNWDYHCKRSKLYIYFSDCQVHGYAACLLKVGRLQIWYLFL